MDNRRKYARSRVIKSGKLVLGRHVVPCVVRNISLGGACVEVQTTYGLPKELAFAIADAPPRAARVVWQTETRLGVAFQVAAA
jgi:PilZ domain